MDLLKTIERMERDVGLVFKRSNVHRDLSAAGELRRPQRGKLFLTKDWHSSYPWQVLRIAVHTYLSIAANVSGRHFSWSDSKDRMEYSPLGERLLLCVDLYRYEQEMLIRDIRDSLRSAAFVESAHFLLFQELLVQQADAIKGVKEYLYLERHRFTREDADALQERLEEAVRALRGTSAQKHNKALYDEAYHAAESIEDYLKGLRGAHPQLEAFAFEICLDTPEGNELAASPLVKRARYQLSSEFPENFLEALKQAAAFVGYLKKFGSAEIKGHLIKLSATAWGEPRCTLLLLGPEVKQLLASGTTQASQLSLIWADFMLGPLGALEGRLGRTMQAPGIRLLPNGEWWLSQKNSSAWKALQDFVDHVFVKELPFMRLRLPRGRRAWSKGRRPDR
ncbi:hypothetical protein [Comamonas jiangduensis]|uniref:Uncharacterized protein n=1 Tax=Comamonas jiangduensis TaxID=1194168 RepID=A0ABV4IGC8_9BURK